MSQETRTRNVDQDMAAIRQGVAEWEAGANAGDAARLARIYTEDSVLMPPHAPAVIGTDSIRTFLQQAFFDPFVLKISLNTEEIQIFGDSAFRRGTYSLTLTPKAGGNDISDNGKYIEIWQRQATDGSWKVARDIWNSDRSL